MANSSAEFGFLFDLLPNQNCNDWSSIDGAVGRIDTFDQNIDWDREFERLFVADGVCADMNWPNEYAFLSSNNPTGTAIDSDYENGIQKDDEPLIDFFNSPPSNDENIQCNAVGSNAADDTGDMENLCTKFGLLLNTQPSNVPCVEKMNNCEDQQSIDTDSDNDVEDDIDWSREFEILFGGDDKDYGDVSNMNWSLEYKLLFGHDEKGARVKSVESVGDEEVIDDGRKQQIRIRLIFE